MRPGIVTRVGQWIDEIWQSKASESMCEYRFHSLENAAIRDKGDLEKRFNDIAASHFKMIQELDGTLKRTLDFLAKPGPDAKELADLKTRVEKIELYSGMKRTVDPTKPPVMKSAFQI